MLQADLAFTVVFLTVCFTIHRFYPRLQAAYASTDRATRKQSIALAQVRHQLRAGGVLGNVRRPVLLLDPNMIGTALLVGSAPVPECGTQALHAPTMFSWYSKDGDIRITFRTIHGDTRRTIERRVTLFQHIKKRGQPARRQRVGEYPLPSVDVKHGEAIDQQALIQQSIAEIQKPVEPPKLTAAPADAKPTTAQPTLITSSSDRAPQAKRFPISYAGILQSAGYEKRNLEDKGKDGATTYKVIDQYCVRLRLDDSEVIPLWGAGLKEVMHATGAQIGERVVITQTGRELVPVEDGSGGAKPFRKNKYELKKE